MKKILLSIGLLTSKMVFSQWTTNYEVNTQVATAPTSDIQSIGTKDGRTYVIFWDESSGYQLRVQLLDVDGTPLFGPNGILANEVADNGTWTATRSNAVDAEGNLYIGFTATNDGNGYVNKISPNGAQMYGANGITIPDGWDLKLLPTADGGVIVGWSGGNKGKIMSYDNTGDANWNIPLEIDSPDASNTITSIGEFAGLSDGSFLAIIHTKATGWTINSIPYVQRFSADGSMIWNEFQQLSSQTLASNRRYPVIQDGDITYFGYYGSTGWRFDSFLQRINPDGTMPWGTDGSDFSIDDNYLEMTTSIAMEEGSDVVWAMANFTNSNQSQYGHFVQKFDKETGERLIDDFGKEVFPVNDQNYIGIGNLQLVEGKPFFLFSNGISNGVNSIQLGVSLLDGNGNFVWEDAYEFIATSEGNKGRYDFTQNVDGQSVAVWTETRGGNSHAFAQNYIVEMATESVSDVDNSNFSIYPNPTQGMLSIQSSQLIQEIEIFNLSGQLLMKNKMENSIDLGNLNPGVYVLKLTTKDGKSKTTKVIRK